MPMGCLCYLDLFGAWRWEAWDADGNVLDSPERYDTREDCLAAATEAGYTVLAPEIPPTGQSLPSDRRRRTVLCVHSDLEAQRFLGAALSDDQCVFAATLNAALQSVNNAQFDAYVLDYWLPDGSAANLCEQLRLNDPHGLVFFFMAAPDAELERRAITLGADASFSRATTPEELRRKLRGLLAWRDRASARAQSAELAAVQEELERRAAGAVAATDHAKTLTRSAMDSITRVRAFRAFIESGGTRANFERLWPYIFHVRREGDS